MADVSKGCEHSVESEQAVLGSMLIEATAVRHALMVLKAEDFYMEAHREVFRAIEEMSGSDAAGGIDLVTVGAQLSRHGNLAKVGGLPALADHIGKVATAAHVKYYCREVKGLSLQRHVVRKLRATYDEMTHENVKDLGDLILKMTGNSTNDLFDFRKDMHAAIDELTDVRTDAIDTGFEKLDEVLCGVEPGDLTVVGGRTSGGKTALMTRWAVNGAQDGRETLYITTEMKPIQMMQRIFPMASGVSAWKFRKRDFKSDDLAAINTAAAEKLSPLPFMIEGRSRVTLDDIRGAIVKAGKPDWVFVDYLQRIRGPRMENRVQEIEEIMVELKTIAQEMNTRVVVGAQLDRGMDKNPSVPPVLADFRGSGAIEHEADFALLLWKPPKQVLDKRFGYAPPPPGDTDIDLIVGKGRSCVSGITINFTLNGELVKMSEKMTRQYDDPQQQMKMRREAAYDTEH